MTIANDVISVDQRKQLIGDILRKVKISIISFNKLNMINNLNGTYAYMEVGDRTEAVKSCLGRVDIF